MIRAAIAAMLIGCSPAVSPPPQRVDGVEVEYRNANLHGANGGASWEDGRPTVWLDVAGLGPARQWFTIAHELCHLRGLRSELGADCCAAAWMRRMDIPIDVVALAAQMWRSDELHPPGPVRAAAIIKCYH